MQDAGLLSSQAPQGHRAVQKISVQSLELRPSYPCTSISLGSHSPRLWAHALSCIHIRPLTAFFRCPAVKPLLSFSDRFHCLQCMAAPITQTPDSLLPLALTLLLFRHQVCHQAFSDTPSSEPPLSLKHSEPAAPPHLPSVSHTWSRDRTLTTAISCPPSRSPRVLDAGQWCCLGVPRGTSNCADMEVPGTGKAPHSLCHPAVRRRADVDGRCPDSARRQTCHSDPFRKVCRAPHCTCGVLLVSEVLGSER